MADEEREGGVRDGTEEGGAARSVEGSLKRGFTGRESCVGEEVEVEDELAWRRVDKGGQRCRQEEWPAAVWGRAESCPRRERKAAGERWDTNGLEVVQVLGSCRRREG